MQSIKTTIIRYDEGGIFMRRDMDLVRLILLEIESSENDEIEDFNIDGYDISSVKYNGELLLQAGLIDKFYEDTMGELVAGHLTWEGCDYLDKIRDNSIWKKTKDAIKEKGLPLVVDTIKTISTAFVTATAEGIANSILKNGGKA